MLEKSFKKLLKPSMKSTYNEEMNNMKKYEREKHKKTESNQWGKGMS